jgi:hypothetical protein
LSLSRVRFSPFNDFANRLKGILQEQGSFAVKLALHEAVPSAVQQQLMQEFKARRGAEEDE